MLQIVDKSYGNGSRLLHLLNRIGDRITNLSQIRNYGSIIDTTKTYANSLKLELEQNPSRGRYLDLHIRVNELGEKDFEEIQHGLKAQIAQESMNIFEHLLSHLDQLIQLRYEMVPTKKARQINVSKEVLDQHRPLYDNAIKSLAEAIGTFLQPLSNQSRDFIEGYIKDSTPLVHRFMNSNLPKAKIKFRSLFGLDKNSDGSKRIRIKASQRSAAYKKKITSVNRLVAVPATDGMYQITLPRGMGVFYAKKISRTYNDGSARFQPLDPDVRSQMLSLSGRDFGVAFLEKAPKIN